MTLDFNNVVVDDCRSRRKQTRRHKGFGRGCRDLRAGPEARRPGRGDSFGDGAAPTIESPEIRHMKEEREREAEREVDVDVVCLNIDTSRFEVGVSFNSPLPSASTSLHNDDNNTVTLVSAGYQARDNLIKGSLVRVLYSQRGLVLVAGARASTFKAGDALSTRTITPAISHLSVLSPPKGAFIKVSALSDSFAQLQPSVFCPRLPLRASQSRQGLRHRLISPAPLQHQHTLPRPGV